APRGVGIAVDGDPSREVLSKGRAWPRATAARPRRATHAGREQQRRCQRSRSGAELRSGPDAPPAVRFEEVESARGRAHAERDVRTAPEETHEDRLDAERG